MTLNITPAGKEGLKKGLPSISFTRPDAHPAERDIILRVALYGYRERVRLLPRFDRNRPRGTHSVPC